MIDGQAGNEARRGYRPARQPPLDGNAGVAARLAKSRSLARLRPHVCGAIESNRDRDGDEHRQLHRDAAPRNSLGPDSRKRSGKSVKLSTPRVILSASPRNSEYVPSVTISGGIRSRGNQHSRLAHRPRCLRPAFSRIAAGSAARHRATACRTARPINPSASRPTVDAAADDYRCHRQCQ